MLNEQADEICRRMIAGAERLRIVARRSAGGPTIVDCGIEAGGGLEAGRMLAEVCLAGMGTVQIVPGDPAIWPGPAISVTTDAPAAACMASQYAGWKVQAGKFFAMGSGPMRAAIGREPLYDKIGFRERPAMAVGVLETRQFPTAEATAALAEACQVPLERLTLLVAPTASQAGGLQIAARSVETALHKLVELGADIGLVQSGFGVAPLPPVAGDDLTAIGRTNDAILYGAHVTLWVRGDEEHWRTIGPRIPASASADFGAPFLELFRRHGGDFYKIDPLLFSPAMVTLINVDTGSVARHGQTRPNILQHSFTS